MPASKLFLIATTAAFAFIGCSHQPTSAHVPQSAETIRKTVRTHIRDIAECYSQFSAKTPNWSGRIFMEWTIDDEGSVSNCKVGKITVAGGEDLGKCMTTKIQTWKFPPSAKDENAAIRYPFVFSPKGNAGQPPSDQ